MRHWHVAAIRKVSRERPLPGGQLNTAPARDITASNSGRSPCPYSKLRNVEKASRIVRRRQTVEHPFGTIKSWMGSTHFQMKTLKHVGTEMALHVLAYNMKRVMRILGVGRLMEAIHA